MTRHTIDLELHFYDQEECVRDEIPVSVEGTYFPPDKGDPWGQSGLVSAPEPAYFEIQEVWWTDPVTKVRAPFPLPISHSMLGALALSCLEQIEAGE